MPGNKLSMTNKSIDELLQTKVVYKIADETDIPQGVPRKAGHYTSLDKVEYKSIDDADAVAREKARNYPEHYSNVYVVECTTTYKIVKKY